ncbi:NAD(P)H-hydrate dehydratase [Geosporobacter ferrireducens]|uniref:Bifunctional NAD(P)H-hydrate repair enzyme n=1 Tax=Geosporobacter ferrireducens TaxID=1424294 RepID=A0A1D8GLC7_9FIRM|nr:NAD(P)H-hydrate dehydratase [Geosporobacter ferrireducens]AOT71698.1 hypothetical protein Gferi_20455 [Geosporobacter ferrireducens]MTI55472.1 NAD(P)H-hydrate dehydratase [Geosporobacter ferrireducens]
MKIVNNTQMKQLDRMTIERYGIPGVLLMENAGIAVFQEVVRHLQNLIGKKVAIVCGRGNNGGDGFVVARHLFQHKVEVKVFIAGNPAVIGGDAKTNFEILKLLEAPIEVLSPGEGRSDLSNQLKEYDLIVDAIFGIGLDRNIDAFIQDVIETINVSEKPVISIDIPSGVSAATGCICGTAVRAEKTVVFQLPKLGNINYPGSDYTGEILIKNIGIPQKVIDSINSEIQMITMDWVKKIIPKRKADTHKGDYGRVYIVAGSTGMTGAAMLTCEAVLRSGAGLVKVAIPQSLNNIMEIRLTEAITVPLPELKKGVVGISDIEKIMKTMSQSDAVAVGPGSGQSRELEEVLRNIFENSTTPIVLDADALNSLANRKELLKLLKSPAVLTPHPMEMSRLTQIAVEDIQKNRVEVAREFAQKWNVIIVLKGARTVVAAPSGETFINTTGNPGMATAGSGDVLTGIITGFIAQGIEPVQATAAAVYIHGLAGDKAAAELGEYGMMAGDIVTHLPCALKEIVGK